MDKAVEKVVERAGSLFGGEFNCAESVLTALLEAAGLKPDDYGSVATPFGGGVGYSDLACGALSGTVLALGLTLPRRKPSDGTAKQVLYDEVRQLTKDFLAAVGATSCTGILGENLSLSGGRERVKANGLSGKNCPRAVEVATRLGAEILKKRQL